MIRHTGGSACAATSTKSSSAARALVSASSIDTTPTCEPSASTRRTFGTRMRSLYRGSFDGGAMTGHCCSSGCASYIEMDTCERPSASSNGARAGERRRLAPLALDPRSLTDGSLITIFRWIVVARWNGRLRCRSLGLTLATEVVTTPPIA